MVKVGRNVYRPVTRRRPLFRSVTKKNNYRAAVRMLRLALIQINGGECKKHYVIFNGSNCHETDPDLLQFAHVHGKETPLKGAGRGSFERLKDVFDHPDSYVLLCVDHHREYDKEK